MPSPHEPSSTGGVAAALLTVLAESAGAALCEALLGETDAEAVASLEPFS